MKLVRDPVEVQRQPLDMQLKLFDFLLKKSRLVYFFGKTVELDRQQGKALARVIVKFPGDAGSLDLLRVDELTPEFAEGMFRLFLIGYVNTGPYVAEELTV